MASGSVKSSFKHTYMCVRARGIFLLGRAVSGQVTSCH